MWVQDAYLTGRHSMVMDLLPCPLFQRARHHAHGVVAALVVAFQRNLLKMCRSSTERPSGMI